MKFPRWTRKRSEIIQPERPPIWLGNRSNGEYFHFQTLYERKLQRLIMQKADENARKVGVPRRDFLASAMGMATSLWCVNLASGCGSNETGHNANLPEGMGGGGGVGGNGGNAGMPGGIDDRPAACETYAIREEMMYDEAAACSLLDQEYFIFDIQTHFFNPNGEWTVRNPGYVNLLRIIVGVPEYDMNAYIQRMFLDSETSMAVISTWPGGLCSPENDAYFNPTADPNVNAPCGLPLSSEEAAEARDAINQLANSQRTINHCMVLPNDFAGVQRQMEIMEMIACERGVGAWKMYPAWGPQGDSGGYLLDNPEIAIPVIEKGLELGINTFCAHKGLPIPGFNASLNHAGEMGRVAKMFPEANFVVYHANINALGGTYEGAYVEGDTQGVNGLITALRDAGVGENENVYAELGSSWSQVMNDGTQAAHYLGKLAKYVGEDNILWGTDSLVGGDPQQEILAMKAATIPQAMQDEFGYPELTTELKAKIFGRNAAAIYGVDPDERRCAIDEGALAHYKREVDGELGKYRWAFDEPMGPKTWDEYMQHAKEHIAAKRPG